jgi:glycosyltransferase involved in cell wall biosynthesis
MILIFEMVWPGTGHAVTNSATIQTIARGFPEQDVRVYAEATHLQELRSASVLLEQTNVALRAIPISSQFMFRPQIVSVRRGLREFWTLLLALRDVPKQEPCLVMLISATPTAIFAGGLLARLMRRQIRMQVGLHGNLNDAFGWRPRNPAARAIDLRAALSRRHGGRVRFLVLEQAILKALADQVPTSADITDVLPLPINQGEAEQARPGQLAVPVRVGLVGQATESKGITHFLALAREFRQTHPDAINFHLVGHPGAGIDIAAFDVLHDTLPYARFSRPQFLEKLQRLHYVCLPLQPAYYGLSASGALLDAITWLKPIIATRVPIIVDLFDRFGDIGFLCDDFDAMRVAIGSLLGNPDQERYDRQVANLQRLRASRMPAALASDYRTMIARGFPGLFSDPCRVPARGMADG